MSTVKANKSKVPYCLAICMSCVQFPLWKMWNPSESDHLYTEISSIMNMPWGPKSCFL